MRLFTHTPAIDKTPLKILGQPEKRTHTVMAVVNDQEIGLRNLAVSLVVN